MMSDKVVESAMQIILHAGDARVACMQALNAIASSDFELAQVKLKEAQKEITNAHRIQTELRDFLKSIRLAYLENYYPDDEDEEGEWTGEEFCFRSNPELRPLEKMFFNERRDLLLDASMERLPELERKYIEYRYGFATGKPMPRSEIAKILDVSEAEAKKIEADALEYFRDCFHVDRVNAFYELRPEAETQKVLALKSQESLFDNFAGTHVDMLLAQYDEEDD